MAVELEHASKEWLAQDRTAQPKACPFCGSDDLLIQPWHGGRRTKTYIQCEGCRISPGACAETYVAAVRAWNRRAGEARLRNELATAIRERDAARIHRDVACKNERATNNENIVLRATVDELELSWGSLGDGHRHILQRAIVRANNSNIPLIEQILNAYAEQEHEIEHAKPDHYSDEFEAFWRLYPRRKEKRRALKAWQSALKRGADPQEIIAGAGRYANECEGKSPKYIKHATTWLNGDCWCDEPDPPEAPQYSQSRAISSLEDMLEDVEHESL